MASRKLSKFKNNYSTDDFIEELQNVTLKQQLKIEEIENALALLNVNKDKSLVTKRNGKLKKLSVHI